MAGERGYNDGERFFSLLTLCLCDKRCFGGGKRIDFPLVYERDRDLSRQARRLFFGAFVACQRLRKVLLRLRRNIPQPVPLVDLPEKVAQNLQPGSLVGIEMRLHLVPVLIQLCFGILPLGRVEGAQNLPVQKLRLLTLSDLIGRGLIVKGRGSHGIDDSILMYIDRFHKKFIRPVFAPGYLHGSPLNRFEEVFVDKNFIFYGFDLGFRFPPTNNVLFSPPLDAKIGRRRQ